MAKYVVLGAGISGLASAALLANAGHQVTVLERNHWIGGKSRRIELAGQRMDTGPALVTFPEVWQQFLNLFDSLGEQKHKEHIDLSFTKLNEVGRYFFRNHVTDLPVKKNHHWHKPWQRFVDKHNQLTPAISKLLTSNPLDPKSFPALLKISKVYGRKLTTDKYISSLSWMPKGLREVIAIHTLNAGVSPKKTLALYASMTAAMATEGISVPVGGVNEIPQALAALARAAGANIRLGESVKSVASKKVVTDTAQYDCDFVVSSLDPEVLSGLMGKTRIPATARSCSGVAIYAVLKEPLPADTVTHSVIMPDEPEKLYGSLEKFEPPTQTMAFVNYYKPGEIYPNTKATVALLLTAPADGKTYDLESDWVKKEVVRISKKLGLKKPITTLFEEHQILDPQYFGEWGAYNGALYGATRRLWQSGPFHTPAHKNFFRPWLIRVGASTHPGGGIPAVLGGVLIAFRKLRRN